MIIGYAVQIVMLVAYLIFVILLFGSIAKKAGFSRWWSLLMFLPLINIASVWLFSFVKWPAETATRK